MTKTISLVRHRVADFDAWRKEYDGFAPIQAEHGVQGHQVLRSIENPNDVIVTHTFDSREAASAFFAMPELKEAMGKAGVDPDKPYMDFQVEQQVQAISGTQVEYPESQRSSGVEGEVQAQFVVNENGRVEPGTFKVLNSPNAAFTAAVKAALSGMRFKPAKIGDTKVSQVVQQSFVFKLNKS